MSAAASVAFHSCSVLIAWLLLLEMRARVGATSAAVRGGDLPAMEGAGKLRKNHFETTFLAVKNYELMFGGVGKNSEKKGVNKSMKTVLLLSTIPCRAQIRSPLAVDGSLA